MHPPLLARRLPGRRELPELVEVEADGKGVGADGPAEGLEAPVPVQDAPHLVHHVITKRPEVRLRLEADEVVGEEPADQGLVARKGHQQVRRRERDVQEEPDPVRGAHAPELLRERDEVIVVDPDEVVAPEVGRHRVREAGVHPEVTPVVEPVVGGVSHPVVKERPEGPVGVAVVVLVVVVRGEVDGRDGEPVRLAEGGRTRAFAHLPAPAEPHPGIALQGRVHGDREPPLRTPVFPVRNADPVGDDDEAAHRAKVQGRLRRTALLMIPTSE